MEFFDEYRMYHRNETKYIRQLLYNYILNFPVSDKENGYYYNRVHNVYFNDEQIYWVLSQTHVIAIESPSQNLAILLDIALEVIFMQKDSHFKYYRDLYFENMTDAEYGEFQKTETGELKCGQIDINKFFKNIIDHYSEMELISEASKEIKTIDNEFPPSLDMKNGNITFNFNKVIIFNRDDILNLLQEDDLPTDKVYRVIKLLN